MAGEGAMNVTFYNGFNANCSIVGFNVIGAGLEKPLLIVFDSPFMNAELPILPNGGKYKIEGKEVKCAGEQSFNIQTFEFDGQAPPVSFDNPLDALSVNHSSTVT